jgi:hypothetical protein
MSAANCTFRVNFYPMQFRNIAGFRDGPLLRYWPLCRDFLGEFWRPPGGGLTGAIALRSIVPAAPRPTQTVPVF